MTSVEFAKIVEQICKRLEFLSVKNPKLIATCKTGEDFENVSLLPQKKPFLLVEYRIIFHTHRAATYFQTSLLNLKMKRNTVLK